MNRNLHSNKLERNTKDDDDDDDDLTDSDDDQPLDRFDDHQETTIIPHDPEYDVYPREF